MRHAAILLTLAALAACEPPEGGTNRTEPPKDDLAAFMGTAQERAARAPYSPPGWPLERGEAISGERRRNLEREFMGGSYYFGFAPFWIGEKLFTARWLTVLDGWDDQLWLEVLPTRYLGHYPDKITSEVFFEPDYPWRDVVLPSHLRGRNPEMLKRVLYARGEFRKRWPSTEMKAEWTRERWLAGYTGEETER